MAKQQQKYVFYQFEFVDKFNLENQNPRRHTNNPSVSAVFGREGSIHSSTLSQ